MAHIRKRARKHSTSYIARYTDPKSTKRIERAFPTRKQARDWLTTQEHSILTGTHTNPNSKTTLNQLTEEWRRSFTNRLSPSTQERYNQELDLYILPQLGSLTLQNLDHPTIQQFVDELATTSNKLNKQPTLLHPSSVRHIYGTLRTLLAKGVRLNLLPSNPAQNIDLPRRIEKEQLILTSEEVNQLADAIQPHYRTLILTAAYTGLRAGELYALTTPDLNLLTRNLTVRRSLTYVQGQQHLGPTKTHQTRTIALPKFLAALLEEHISRMPTAAPAHPGGEQPTSFLFTHHRTGEPIRHNNFYINYFKKAVYRSLPASKHGLRFHDLRHTCASLLIAQGAHPKLISTRLGHSSIQITLDRYSHLFPSLEESLADALDNLYNSTPATQPASNVRELRR